MKQEQNTGGLHLSLPANPLQALTGREPHTTFWQDFSIADAYGLKAIQDTYNRAFAEWRTNAVYIAEFVVTLNHKIWYHYELQQNALRRAAEAKTAAAAATDEESKKAAADEQVKQTRIAEAAQDFCTLYDRLWKEADGWCMDNLKGDDLQFYLDFTD